MKPINIITDKNVIIGFLKGEIADPFDRMFEDILNFEDAEMEKCHQWIQQIFPLHEMSKHASTYPILTPEIVKDAKQHPEIISNLHKAKDRFEKFLAIGNYEDIDKQRKWCKHRNHNLLRITRVIRSLRLFGMEKEAKELYNNAIVTANRFGVSIVTILYWQKALKDDVWNPIQD